MMTLRKSLLAAGCAALMAAAPLMFAQAKKGGAGDAAKGKSTFEDNCAVCHNADSDEKKMGPGLKGEMKKAKMQNGKAPTEANVRALINAGGNGMPSFADVLSDKERDDVLAYLKSL